jgi:Tol biopolymer transport system component
VWQGSPLDETRPATANPDGSDFTLLDSYPELQQGLFCAYWSPNGARFLCNSNDQVGTPPPPGAAGIYTVRSSDGGDLAQVIATPDGSFDVGRGYSPDGSRILFLRIDQSNDHAALYAMNPDGTNLLRLSPPGLSVIEFDFFEGLEDWSPDGSHVTFAAQNLSRQGSPTALYVVNADGPASARSRPPGSVPSPPNGPRTVG